MVIKNKYIAPKKQLDDSLIGEGSFGSVVVNPRLPLLNETFINLFTYTEPINEVSKIFKNKNYYLTEINKINELIINNPLCFNSKYFVLPIKFGNINLNEVYNNVEYYDDVLHLLEDDTMQIVYEKCYPVIDTNSQYTHEKKNHKIFLTSFMNILNCIDELQNNLLFLDDLKFDNIVYDKTKKFKLIDYSSTMDFKKIMSEPDIEKKDLALKKLLSESILCQPGTLYSLTNNPIISALVREYVSNNNKSAIDILLNTRMNNDSVGNLEMLFWCFNESIRNKTYIINGAIEIKFGDILTIYHVIYNKGYPNRDIILKKIINLLNELPGNKLYQLLEINHMFSITNLILEYNYFSGCQNNDSILNLLVSATKIIVIGDNVYLTPHNVKTIKSSINV